MVWFLWFVAAATYYGVVLLSTELLNSSEGVCQAAESSAVDDGGEGKNVSFVETETECSLHQCRFDHFVPKIQSCRLHTRLVVSLSQIQIFQN